ncbi:MAG: alpha/beta hydrolase [Bacteroidota bacterium]
MKHLVTRFLCLLFPSLMVKMAYRLLTSPQVHKLRPHEEEVLATASKRRIAYQDFDIQLYEWPGEGEKVLLVHGWEGQAGNFAEIIEALQASNFHVLAFDAPSHGMSSKGATSLFEFRELTGHLISDFQTSYLVSHSFGGVATTSGLYELGDYPIEAYVLLTTPDTFQERIDSVSMQAGIADNVKQRLIRIMEAEAGQPIEELGVSKLVPFLKVKRVLILHDLNDRVIPISQAQQVAGNWPVARLEVIEGTGHFRILRTPEVIQRAVDFLKAEP